MFEHEYGTGGTKFGQKYTPLYGNGIKKTQIKSMETTNQNKAPVSEKFQ